MKVKVCDCVEVNGVGIGKVAGKLASKLAGKEAGKGAGRVDGVREVVRSIPRIFYENLLILFGVAVLKQICRHRLICHFYHKIKTWGALSCGKKLSIFCN